MIEQIRHFAGQGISRGGAGRGGGDRVVFGGHEDFGGFLGDFAGGGVHAAGDEAGRVGSGGVG